MEVKIGKTASHLVFIVIVVACGWLFSGTASADSLSIKLNAAATLNLQLQGSTNKDYVIQTTDTLAASSHWSNFLAGATDGAGFFTTNAPTPVSAELFYRSMSLPPLRTTTTQATANENTALTIMLGGYDPLFTNSTLNAVITQLPAHGQLAQLNNSPITSVPATVNNPSRQVIYIPPTNGLGTNYDAFSYLVQRASNGVTSASQSLSVSIVFTPELPVPTLFKLQAIEDAPLIFQLTGTDPTPPPGAGTLTFVIDVPCVAGRLYQVQPDNTTAGPVILSTEVTVTNANNLLLYQPPLHVFGSQYETFIYHVVNSYGQKSYSPQVPISITETYHAPTVTDGVVLGVNEEFVIPVELNYSEIDPETPSVYFTALPTNGYLYNQGSNLVVTNMAYSVNDFGYVKTTSQTNCLGIFEAYGSNYDHFAFYAENEQGMVSGIATNTINIQYVNTPPSPTGPTNVNALVNLGSQTEDSPAAVNITLSATDVDGDYPLFALTSLTQHGSLYYLDTDINASGFGFPIQLPSDTASSTLTYIPDPGYNSGQGLDSFTYTVSDYRDINPCTFTVTLAVSGPVMTTEPAITVSVNSAGTYVTNGALTGFMLFDDATADPTDNRVTCTILPVMGTNSSAMVAGGSFLIRPTPRVSGLQVAYPDGGGIELTDFPTNFNLAFLNSNFLYQASSTNGAAYLSFSLKQLSGDALTNTFYLPVTYVAQ